MGRKIADRYEIINTVGEGGMADVYLAQDNRLNRRVALKILKTNLIDDQESLQRFRKEAISSASLNHPNIVQVYDSGDEVTIDDDGKAHHEPYIVMELVAGKTLKDLLLEYNQLSVNNSLSIVKGILNALAYSHSQGIVHRDIKPANIMITNDGTIKVMDFGIARAINSNTSNSITKTSAVVGTASYFSPEQAQGFGADNRSDLYSVGCVFYEMLTGRQPFSGENAVAVATMHVTKDIPLPSSIDSNIPTYIDNIVKKAMAKDPNERYQSANDFIAGLDDNSNNDNPTEVLQATAINEKLELTSTKDDLEPIVIEDDEELKKAKKKKLIIIFSIIGGAILLLIILGLIIFGGGNNSNDDMNATIPVVVPTTPKETACAPIEAAGFKCTILEQPSDSIPVGQLISETPAGDSQALKGTEVTLIYSSGINESEVPDVTGLSQAEARSKLIEAGFTVGDIKEADDSKLDKDLVVKTYPKKFAKVPKGQEITIYLSSGNVTLPDFSGLTKAAASATLTKLGLSIEYETEPSSSKEGIVLSQNPGASSVPQGSTVTLIISASDKVTVPTVVGRDEATARALLEKLGFTVESQDENSSNYGTGKVIRTNPTPGKTVTKGSKITLYISAGAPVT
jgi:serine/threonine-protein kinase